MTWTSSGRSTKCLKVMVSKRQKARPFVSPHPPPPVHFLARNNKKLWKDIFISTCFIKEKNDKPFANAFRKRAIMCTKKHPKFAIKPSPKNNQKQKRQVGHLSAKTHHQKLHPKKECLFSSPVVSPFGQKGA